MLNVFSKIIDPQEIGIPTTEANSNTTEVIFNYIAGVAASVAVVMIVISGFRLVIARGNSEAVGKSVSTIIYASVGLVVVIAARLIAGMVLGWVS